MSSAYPDMPEDFAPFAEPSNHRELNLIAEEYAAAIPIEKVHRLPKFHPPSPERCYSPCGKPFDKCIEVKHSFPRSRLLPRSR